MTTGGSNISTDSGTNDAHLIVLLYQVSTATTSDDTVAVWYDPANSGATTFGAASDPSTATATVSVSTGTDTAANPATTTFVTGPQEYCTDPAIASDLGYRWDGVHAYKPGAKLTIEAAAAALLAIYPFASAFGMAYTESLFLLLTVGAFLAAERGRRPVAGILLALATLTRLQGAALALPLVLLLLRKDGWRPKRTPCQPSETCGPDAPSPRTPAPPRATDRSERLSGRLAD